MHSFKTALSIIDFTIDITVSTFRTKKGRSSTKGTEKGNIITNMLQNEFFICMCNSDSQRGKNLMATLDFNIVPQYISKKLNLILVHILHSVLFAVRTYAF